MSAGSEPADRDRLGDRVVEGREHLVGEELAVAVQQLVVERRLSRALGDRRLPRQRAQLAVEVLELHDHEPVDDVDVGVEPLGGPGERELGRVGGRGEVHRLHRARCGCPAWRNARGSGSRPREWRRAGRRGARPDRPRRTRRRDGCPASWGSLSLPSSPTSLASPQYRSHVTAPEAAANRVALTR